MLSAEDALAQLKVWHAASTRLFLHWSGPNMHGWCVGKLMHPSSAELHFGIEGIDGKDFLFVINIHQTYNPRFEFLDVRDGLPFFAPQRERDHFGKVLKISLKVDQYGESQGQIVLAEFFSKTAIQL